MAPFFVYLIKSSISLALFYVVFRLVMSRDTNHSLNRFLLLGILAASAIISLLNFQLFKEEVIIQPVSVIRDFIYTPIEFADVPQTLQVMVAEPVQKGIEINWWLIGYCVAIAALFIRLAISLLRVVQLVRKSEKLPLNKFIIAVIKEMVQPFSFLRYIVISEKDYTENKKAVLAHEQEHIRQLHSIDLLVCEMFTLLHWFNPFMWLLRRDLKMIHEFQADQAVLNTGIDAKKYQLLVVEKAVGERRFALANHFTQKPILKRISMMKKKNISKWGATKILLFVPLIFLLLSMNGNLFNGGVSSFKKESKANWLKMWSYENLENVGENILTEIGHNPAYGDFKKTKAVSLNNVLLLLIDKDNNILVKGEVVQKEELKSIISNFVVDGINSDGEKVSEIITKELPHYGKVDVPQGFINFRFDVSASYWAVRETIDYIGEVFLKIKDEKSFQAFNHPYLMLGKKDQSEIDQIVPIRISTGEPMIKDGLVAFADGI